MNIAMLQAAPAANPLMQFLPLVGMGLLFYFLMIRPQSKARKAMEERLSKLKSGDEVVLHGGLFATVDRLDEKDAKVIWLKLGSATVKARRSAVAQLAAEPEAQS